MNFRKFFRIERKRSWIFSYYSCFNSNNIRGDVEVSTTGKLNTEAMTNIREIIRQNLIKSGIVTEAAKPPTITFFKEIDK